MYVYYGIQRQYKTKTATGSKNQENWKLYQLNS